MCTVPMVLEVVLVVLEVVLQLLLLQLLLLQPHVREKLPSPTGGGINNFDTPTPAIWGFKQAQDRLLMYKLDLPDPIFGVPEL